MMERMQFVAGWIDFTLNTGLKLNIMVNMKGLEAYTFNECLQIATIAEIENIQIPFLYINQLIANKKAINCNKEKWMLQRLKK